MRVAETLAPDPVEPVTAPFLKLAAPPKGEAIDAQQPRMRPTLYAPPESLSGYVECFWTLEAGPDDIGATLSTFANGVSGIIFQHRDGRSGLGPATAHQHPFRNADIPTSFLYGKRTVPSHTFAKGAFALTGVVFTPQALSTLLNIQPSDVTNAPVALADVSGENVGETLINARSQQERFAVFSQFLRARVSRARPEDQVVTASLRLIHRGIRSIRVQHLLKCLSISERQFERRFIRAIGISPHQYIRIVRFQEAMQLLRTTQFERLSDVAHNLNYADQSHFIKDTKEFSGHTPTRLLEIVRTCVDFPCGVIPPRTFSGGDLLRQESQDIAACQP